MKQLNIATTLCLTAWMVGCGADQGTKPHDMSEAQHEAMAKNEESSATGHAEQHDPNATKPTPVCAAKGGCWTSTSNPTAQHAEDAKHHHELAAKHRAAATALADAEARACGGISEDDRDVIEKTFNRSRYVKAGKSSTQKEVGATVVFRAVRA